MRARAAFALVGAFLAFLFLFASCNPVVKQLPTPTGGPLPGAGLPTPAPNTTPQPALLEKRLLVLEWPETMRENDSDLVELTVAMDERVQPTQPPQQGPPLPVDIPDLYATHNLLAVARLDLAGMEAYRENQREPLLPGKPVTFQWSIHANAPGTYRGVVWLHLELVPKNGGSVDELLLLAAPIEVRVSNILGLPGNVARFLGGIGLVASTLLGYPFIQRWLEPWLNRRKKRRKPAPTAKEKREEEEEVPHTKK